MTTISPAYVSMYDFLYQDTQSMLSLLADEAQLSLPQTRIATTASLQAIVSALLAYQQRHQGPSVNKKLFTRSAVKEIRKYNSMNFATIKAILYYRQDVAGVIFNDDAHIKICEYIAAQIDAKVDKVQDLLNVLCVVALRELAIVADYSQLDNEEIDKWFALQPQFLAQQRFEHTALNNRQKDNASFNKESMDKEGIDKEPVTQAINKDADLEPRSDNQNSLSLPIPPPFDPYWHQITKFRVEQVEPVQDMQQATSNYLKAIGRVRENAQSGRHDDMLVFAQMPAIALPHQRWLLQLAKISEIYLSRNRLRITSEPKTPPARPLVSLSFMDANKEDTPTTTSETPIEYDKPKPLWKNPAIIITVLVIAVLGAMAFLKYQLKQSHANDTANNGVVVPAEARTQQDVAIVRVEEDENDENTDLESAASEE